MNNVVVVLTLMTILASCVALISTRKVTYSEKLTVFVTPASHGSVIHQANGTTTETIKLKDIGIKDLSNRRLNTEVKLEVRRGSVRLELLDSEGQPTASIASIPGKRVLGKGYLVADVSTNTLKYRITAIEAENINYELTIHTQQL